MSWIEVRAEFAEGLADTSLLVDVFREYGIENTLEDATCLTGCIVAVEGAPEIVAKLVPALIEAGAVDVKTQELPEENWDELWKQHFKPRRVGTHLVVRPSWESYDFADGDIELVLDPGQAFGTGEHATTRMCLEMLEATDLASKTLMDLGCGSGILSVAAVKLGASRVVAIDIDPLSVEVTRENARLNDVDFDMHEGNGLPEGVPQAFDVLVSNIISATLIRLAPDAARYVTPGGMWIVSGIIEENWPDVRSAALGSGFSLHDERNEEGWVAARFLRN